MQGRATHKGHEQAAGLQLHAVVAGYASLDRIYRVNRLPAPGTTGIVETGDDRIYWGGCAFNIAVGLARLGIDTGIIGTLGTDPEGERYNQWLRSNGVDTTAVARCEDTGTARSSLYYDPAGTSVCYYWPGASGFLGQVEPEKQALARADWLVLSVAPAQLTSRLLDEAEAGSTAIAWSVKADSQAYPPALVERLLTDSRIVFLNQAELDFVGRATGRDTVEKVLQAGADTVVLTLGAAGSRVATHEASIEVPSAPVRRVVDATGSGDAYVAGFLAALIRGLLPGDAALVGAANAASVLEQVGSQTGLCTWEEQRWRQDK